MSQDLPLSLVELLFRKLDPGKFQARFLEAITRVQNVPRGSIWIKRGDEYICSEATGGEAHKVKGVTVKASVKSVVGDVIKSGKMIVAEAASSPFFQGIEDKLDRKNSLILCFPLTLKDGSVYGAVQLLDTKAGDSSMNLAPNYLELLEGLVRVGGIALSISLDLEQQREQNVRMRRMLDDLRSSPPMIGQSRAYMEMRRYAEIYAANTFPVLITGESGTGKELIAREIHRLSARSEKPFLVQNCSAIPENLLESELFGYRKGAFTGANKDKTGLFEAADGGTVFLDEIGDMAVSLQGKILRFLQSSEIKPLGTPATCRVDVRVVAATNQNLEMGIENGTFREDLYYRLNVLPLRMPSIRERKDDIPLLLAHFMRHFAQLSGKEPKKFSTEVVERLTSYHWPGNVRQMENVVKYLLTVTGGNTVEKTDLPPFPAAEAQVSQQASSSPEPRRRKGDTEPAESPKGNLTGDLTLTEIEKAHILSLLSKTKWNVTAAANLAGLKRTTLASRMKKLGISRD